MPRRKMKSSVFKLGHNFSIDMWLGTHYDSNVLPVSTINTTIYFVLRVVSAEFQTSRSEAHQKRGLHKLLLPDSYLYNLPNSAKGFYNITITKMIENFKEQNFGKYIRNKGVIQKYLILN
jgi:hypothetical protein